MYGDLYTYARFPQCFECIALPRCKESCSKIKVKLKLDIVRNLSKTADQKTIDETLYYLMVDKRAYKDIIMELLPLASQSSRERTLASVENFTCSRIDIARQILSLGVSDNAKQEAVKNAISEFHFRRKRTIKKVVLQIVTLICKTGYNDDCTSMKWFVRELVKYGVTTDEVEAVETLLGVVSDDSFGNLVLSTIGCVWSSKMAKLLVAKAKEKENPNLESLLWQAVRYCNTVAVNEILLQGGHIYAGKILERIGFPVITKQVESLLQAAASLTPTL